MTDHGRPPGASSTRRHPTGQGTAASARRVTWRVQLMGGLRAEAGERAITRFRTQKTAALLTYLALYPERPHPREALLAALWPNVEPTAGRHNLSTALSSLRHQFASPSESGGALFLADRDTLRLDPERVSTDVGEFDTLVSAFRAAPASPGAVDGLSKAVELYQGDLVPGLYEDWIEVDRRRLEGRYRDALDALVALLEAKGQTDRAIGLVERALARDPADESLRATLLRLYGPAHPLPPHQPRPPRPSSVPLPVPLPPVTAPEAPWPAAEGDPEGADMGEGAPARAKYDDSPDAPTPSATRAVAASTGSNATSTTAQPAPTLPQLPQPADRFFGRAGELAGLCQSLTARDARLVTLIGPGGIGKTRLAVEAVRAVAAGYAGRLNWIALADCASVAGMAEVVRTGLAPDPFNKPPPLEKRLAAIGTTDWLVVMDNLEQLLPDGVAVVSQVLAGAPGILCLVTSRRPLGLPGEQVWRLDPLPTPGVHESAERLATNASVQLYLDRAQAVRPELRLTPANAPAIASLCARLEGLPLAIELAAGWSHVLTPQDTLARLEAQAGELGNRRSGRARRHQTLQTAIEWSTDLLDPPTRRFFTQLSAFRGGWTAEAAAVVCADDLAQDRLAELTDCSLAVHQPDGNGGRYGMLDLLRDFAARRLDADERQALWRRHAAYYLEMAEAAERELEGPKQTHWLQRLAEEHDNCRAVLDRALAHPDQYGEIGLNLAGRLAGFWVMRGHVAEGADWLQRLVALPHSGAVTTVRAAGLNGAGTLSALTGDLKVAEAYWRECLPQFEALGNQRGASKVLNNLAVTARMRGDHATAKALHERALVLRRALQDQSGIASSLNNLSHVVFDLHDDASAIAYLEECLAIHRDMGDRNGIAQSLNNLGEVLLAAGETAQARAFLEESLAICEATDRPSGVAEAQRNLGLAALYGGQLEAAGNHLFQSASASRRMGNPQLIAQVLEALALWSAQSGNPAAAVAEWAGAGLLRRRTGTPPSPRQQPVHVAARERLRLELGADEFDAAWAGAEAKGWAAILDELIGEDGASRDDA